MPGPRRLLRPCRKHLCSRSKPSSPRRGWKRLYLFPFTVCPIGGRCQCNSTRSGHAEHSCPQPSPILRRGCGSRLRDSPVRHGFPLAKESSTALQGNGGEPERWLGKASHSPRIAVTIFAVESASTKFVRTKNGGREPLQVHHHERQCALALEEAFRNWRPRTPPPLQHQQLVSLLTPHHLRIDVSGVIARIPCFEGK